jgi:hypothetical protein
MRRSIFSIGALCAALLATHARLQAQTFGPPQCWTTSNPPQQIVIADADGDGLKDLLTVGNPYPTLYVATAGTPAPPVLANVEALPLNAGPIDTGDLDQDGDLDIVAASSTIVTVLRRTGATYQRTNIGLVPSGFGAFGTRARVVDIEGDGDVDIVVGGRQVLLNDGAGNLANPVLLTLPSGAAWSSAYSQWDVADVDGDGDQDVIAFAPANPGNPASAVVAVLLHDGALGFTQGWTQPSPTGHFLVGDLDGDSDPDLVFGITHGVQLYVNDGTGQFVALGPALMTLDILPPYGAFLGDTDNDGDLEMLVLGPVTVLGRSTDIYDVGPAGFALDHNLPGAHATLTLAVGDLDGDGVNDIVAVRGVGVFIVCFVPGQGPLAHLITKTAGDLQGGNRSAVFASPLRVRVTALAGGGPVVGALVTFTSIAPGQQTLLQTVATDANGDAALSVTATPYSGPLIVHAAAANAEPVDFSLYVRSYEIEYVVVFGIMVATLNTDLPSIPLIMAFDFPLPAPGYTSTSAGDIYTSILAPALTLVLFDGIGLFGPAEPGLVTSPSGRYVRYIAGLTPLNGSGLTLVSQVYALAPAEIFVSNPVSVTF